MKNTDIKELGVKELNERITEEQQNLTRLKINHAVSQLDNPQKIKNTKRNIARMLTELRSREMNTKA